MACELVFTDMVKINLFQSTGTIKREPCANIFESILYTRIRPGSKCNAKYVFLYKPFIQRVWFHDIIPNNRDSCLWSECHVASLLKIKVFNYMGLTWGFLIQRHGKQSIQTDVITAVWGWQHTLIIIIIITLNGGKWIVAHKASVSRSFILNRSYINVEGNRFLYVSL